MQKNLKTSYLKELGEMLNTGFDTYELGNDVVYTKNKSRKKKGEIIDELAYNIYGDDLALIRRYSIKLLKDKKLSNDVYECLKHMETYELIKIAHSVKYICQIIKKPSGKQYFQLRGTIGTWQKKQEWVYLNLGSEESVLENYGTIDVNKLVKMNKNLMVAAAYLKIKSLQENFNASK